MVGRDADGRGSGIGFLLSGLGVIALIALVVST